MQILAILLGGVFCKNFAFFGTPIGELRRALSSTVLCPF